MITAKAGAWEEEIARLAEKGGASAWALAVHDYESGRAFEANAERTFHAASTIKVAVLLALFHATDRGELRLDDSLHVRNRFRSAADESFFRLSESSDGYPDLYKRIGRTEKIGRLAEWMIIWSSNLATNLLVDFLGVSRVQRTLTEAQVRGVEFCRGVDDEKAFQSGLNNEVTARGLIALFAALRGDFLSKTSRDEVIRILLEQKFDSMIPAGLPKHATAAHKTGEISTVCHDAGIVYVPEREPYLVAILTESTAAADARRKTVAEISEAVYRRIV